MAVLTRRAADVRINEIDLSASITDNSSATTALVLVSSRGPETPTYYTNPTDFRFDFGDPKASVSFDHYAALDYLKEGNSLWAVRALGTGSAYAGAVLRLGTSAPDTGVTSLVGMAIPSPSVVDWVGYSTSTTRALLRFTSKRGAGSYGNSIAISIDSENLDPPSAAPVATVSSSGGALASGNYVYRVSAVSNSSESLVTATVTATAATGSSNAVTLTWPAVPGAIGYRVYGRSSGSVTLLGSVGALTTTFTDDGSATPGTQLPITSASNLVISPRFTVKVYDTSVSATLPVESFYCSVTEDVDETGTQMEVRQRINPFSQYIRVESDLLTYGDDAAAQICLKSVSTPVSLSGGASGSAPTTAQINAAWSLFLNKELYVIDTLIGSGRGSVPVYQQMEYVARTRNDSVAFIDVPSSMQKAQTAVDWRNLTLNLNSSYAAIFGNDLLQNDPINGKLLYLPQSGTAAGLFARATRVAQPWFSIAGLNRGTLNVAGIRYSYDDGEATLLAKAQVNYARKFVGRGIALWEQWTAYNKSSALQFLNVRFLCNVLKRSMYSYLLYGLQEPNDDILRTQLKTSLEDYLRIVQAGRGIKSFRVVIDETNNPPALVNSGVLAIAIIIVPILAVREIQLTLAVSKEGMTVSEKEIASFSA